VTASNSLFEYQEIRFGGFLFGLLGNRRCRGGGVLLDEQKKLQTITNSSLETPGIAQRCWEGSRKGKEPSKQALSAHHRDEFQGKVEGENPIWPPRSLYGCQSGNRPNTHAVREH